MVGRGKGGRWDSWLWAWPGIGAVGGVALRRREGGSSSQGGGRTIQGPGVPATSGMPCCLWAWWEYVVCYGRGKVCMSHKKPHLPFEKKREVV